MARSPRPKSIEEEAFLAIGEGAKLWLLEAAAAGTHKIHFKMERAVALSKLYGKKAVDEALEVAATSSRFSEEDLASILAYRNSHPEHDDRQDAAALLLRADIHTLQRGTASWRRFGG